MNNKLRITKGEFQNQSKGECLSPSGGCRNTWCPWSKIESHSTGKGILWHKNSSALVNRTSFWDQQCPVKNVYSLSSLLINRHLQSFSEELKSKWHPKERAHEPEHLCLTFAGFNVVILADERKKHSQEDPSKVFYIRTILNQIMLFLEDIILVCGLSIPPSPSFSRLCRITTTHSAAFSSIWLYHSYSAHLRIPRRWQFA